MVPVIQRGLPCGTRVQGISSKLRSRLASCSVCVLFILIRLHGQVTSLGCFTYWKIVIIKIISLKYSGVILTGHAHRCRNYSVKEENESERGASPFPLAYQSLSCTNRKDATCRSCDTRDSPVFKSNNLLRLLYNRNRKGTNNPRNR